MCVYVYVTRIGFLQCKSKKIYSGNTIEGLNLILKRFADWICQACHLCWLDLSNMSWRLIESVKYAMCVDWVCEACHVCWLDLSTVPCGLIGSVKHAMRADQICQICHMCWLDLSFMPYGLTPYVSSPFWQFQFAWFLALFQSSSSTCCTPPYRRLLFMHSEWNQACVN